MDSDGSEGNTELVCREEDFLEIHCGASRLMGWHVGALGEIRQDVPLEGTWEVLPRI